VPLGTYVVHQAAAPAGLVPAADVPFTIDLPGQTAVLAFINGAAPTAGAPAVAESGSAPSFGSANVLPPPPPPPAIVTSAPIAPPSKSALKRVIAAPGDMASFLAREPMEAALFAGVWGLLLAPAYLLVRRRKLSLAKEGA
jgi:hypothetical protein